MGMYQSFNEISELIGSLERLPVEGDKRSIKEMWEQKNKKKQYEQKLWMEALAKKAE